MKSTTLSTALAKTCADAGVPVVLFNRVPDNERAGSLCTSSVIVELSRRAAWSPSHC